MLIPNQKILMKWNGSNKKHYESLKDENGNQKYFWSGVSVEFIVDAEELPYGSKELVKVKCDFCPIEKQVIFNQYYKQVVEKNLDKYACKDCSGKRVAENHNKELTGLKFVKQCDIKRYEGVIYHLNHEKVNQLNNVQKILINEIIRYCEENEKFPEEKALTNKNGYVSRSQFYKYFNTKSFADLYQYIFPLIKETRNNKITAIQKELNIPKYHQCIKCKKVKHFTFEFFSKNPAGKYGLRTMCRECENKYSNILNYKKKGIIFNEFTDISPEKWWEYFYEGKIGYMPEFCYLDENVIRIIRHALITYLNKTKEEIRIMKIDDYKKFSLFPLYYKTFNGQLDFFTRCFPEFQFRSTDMLITRNPSDDDIIYLVDKFIDNFNLSLEAILNSEYNTKSDKKLNSIVTHNYQSFNALFVWYFDKKGINLNGRKITEFDFKVKSNKFWSERANRINAIQSYCEFNDIHSVINDTKELKKWIYKHFRQQHLLKVVDYGAYYETLYNVLVDAYPEIITNKTLFEWEWHQYAKNDKESLNKMLREMLTIRENKTSHEEISKFLRHSILMDKGYAKFTKQISKGRFNNYYEWACQAYPEYSTQWNIKDFYDFIAQDGTICDSFEEVKIYEFIKFQLGIQNIKAIGTSFSGEHIFKLPNEAKDSWYCPDFVFEGETPIYIEYYGMFNNNPPKGNKLLKRYKEKTLRKIEYYNSTSFDFIYIFPEDIKPSFRGLIEKLNIFLSNNKLKVV